MEENQKPVSKRQRVDSFSGNIEHDGTEHLEYNQETASVTSQHAEEGQPDRLACPFFKRNPLKEPKHVSCFFPGFSSISRLKEHLYRKHMSVPICPRCHQAFDSPADLTTHTKDVVACQPAEGTPIREGITEAQEKRLRSKRRVKGEETVEEKWRSIYQLLFPDSSSIPSPYVDDAKINSLRMEGFLHSLFKEYEAYLAIELPPLIKDRLEKFGTENLAVSEPSLMDRLAEMLFKCQSELASRFERQRFSSKTPMRSYNLGLP